jgi:nucleotide-binding universal stress UspA family protein
MYNKILLPTDGSEHSIKAAEHALWIAGSSGAEIIVLNVLETYSLSRLPVIETSPMVGTPEEDLLTGEDFIKIKEIWEKEAKSSFEKISNLKMKISAENNFKKDFKLSLKIKEDHPAETILKTIESDNIDLLVMGSSGKHALERFLLGSVAEKVIRSAICPVLVVKSLKE